MAKMLTQSQIKNQIIDDSGLTRAGVSEVLDSLMSIIEKEFKTHGEFKLLGLVKFTAIKKDAVKGGISKPNPFKPGEMMVTKAKPASIKVKARPLAKLKEMV